MLIESESAVSAKLAITLEESGANCVMRFWYWFSGTNVDTIRVQGTHGAELVTLGEAKGYDKWTKAEIPIPSKSSEFDVRACQILGLLIHLIALN